MINKDLFNDALSLIKTSKNILITTHTRPDGDACGSLAALKLALENINKNTKTLFLSPVPKWYQFLFDADQPTLGIDVTPEQLYSSDFFQPDLVILVDVNSNAQIQEFQKYLQNNNIPVLVLDHHHTNDSLGSVELVDSSASAAGVIVTEFFNYANFNINKNIAQALFTAVATDTGWFRFQNTDTRTLNTAALLIEKGAQPQSIYHYIYQNYSFQRFKLLTKMLDTTQLYCNNSLAIQFLTKKDFADANAKYSDTENFIDYCRCIDSVKAAALIVEIEKEKVKCSLRASGDIDVSKIAQVFGGGGHKVAAGCHINASVEQAKELLIEHFQMQI